MINELKNKIKGNKKCLILMLILFVVFTYCHFNTMILNDDLPYSLYFRVNNRIDSVVGIIKNQIFDYSNINARVFLHCIVQFLLIYDKNLWSILNPIVIIINIALITYFIKIITKAKIKNINLLILSTIAFLLLYNHKYLIYWVAGSVNYVWVFLLLILFSIYYYKYGLLKYKKITSIICLFGSMICEASAIFIIGVVLSDLLINLFIKKESKNIIKPYILFLILSICGFLFILLAPSTLNRLDGDSSWQNLSVIKKLMITIPVISSNLFRISIYNIYPLLNSLSIVFYFYKKDSKKALIILIILLILFIISYLLGGFTWFILSITLFLLQFIIFYHEKNYKLISILICIYLISYSIAITNEYSAGRVNMHFYLFSFAFSIYNYLKVEKFNKLFKIVSFFLITILIILELVIYSYIGEVKRDRLNSIRKVQAGETKILETRIIKKPFDKFHIDANSPGDKKYWAYQAFEDYYKLPDDIEIIVKK